MPEMPTLGGVSDKYAGAYLLRPDTKLKKKKKKKKQDESLDKMATDAGLVAFNSVRAVMRKQIQSGDLGGGWNPADQLIENNS